MTDSCSQEGVEAEEAGMQTVAVQETPRNSEEAEDREPEHENNAEENIDEAFPPKPPAQHFRPKFSR